MKDSGIVIYLKASIEKLFSRIERDHKSNRPLLKAKDSYKTLKELFESRKTYYSSIADLIIDTDSLSAQETCKFILERLEVLGKTNGYCQC